MCCTPSRCVLVCVHASPMFVAKCQTGTLSLVCGDTTSGCLLRNYCISCYVVDLEEFVVRRKKIFASLPCSQVQSGMFTVVDLSKGFRFQSPSPLSVWLVGWIGLTILVSSSALRSQRGPSRTHGQFFDFEIGAHDGAYKGRLHTAVPYIGRKTLTDDQQEYNDVHGFYCARVEHLFARLWQWRIVRNVWTRSATELHGHVRILLHLTQFCIRRQTRYQPYGPWPHVPESVWAQEEATVVEEENDDGVCCQLCGHRPGDISECGTCHLNMCASCMPLHSCTL